MDNNKKPVTLLDILTNAKSRGARTLKDAVNYQSSKDDGLQRA